MECCFGPGAAIYDSIMVDMDESSGKTVKFTTRPVTVEGEFVVKELIGPDDKFVPGGMIELDTGNARYLIRFTQTLERQAGWAWALFSAVRKLGP